MTATSCIECGELSDGPHCDQHKPKPRKRSHFRSNPSSWKKLSARLRRMQPWCSTCGTSEDLTVDHIIPFSERPDLAYDVNNLTVLCRSHNSSKGTGGVDPEDPVFPPGRRPNLDHTRPGYRLYGPQRPSVGPSVGPSDGPGVV